MEEVFQYSTFNEYKEYLNRVKAENDKVRDAYNLLDDDDEKIDIVLQDESLTPREIIEIIALCRRSNYKKTAGGANKAAENETDRLYAKNPWKFVEEFLQNADDCNYSSNPQIDIIIDEKDEAHPFIEFVYNEDGFSRGDIWAITAFSESTKVNDTVSKQDENGVFYKEKTGRKGKGFKAVFSLNAENIVVHIRSNGFSFKLDNRIGRIMPIWENDLARMDGKTHVIVEIINPNFGQTSVKDIYPEFKRLFCIESKESIFANSPFLFMHRIKSVHISRINNSGVEDFTTEYRERKENTIYRKPYAINHQKIMLAGIADNGTYYQEQLQIGDIITWVNEFDYSIPVLRYTRMIEDNECYRNYSIIAPIITNETKIDWSQGALFRTFPMSLHPINMPLAIDAPFILNPDRSGIQYNFTAEDGSGSLADVWNTEVSNHLFEKEGVLESFFLWIRTIKDIRIDKYMVAEKVVLFEDKNNSDGHGNTWVPIVDISELCHKYPVFKLFAKNDEYVSFDNAQTVKKNLFYWPHVESLFSLILGEDYEKYILSREYIGSSLFNAKPIVKQGFSVAVNKYLDEVELDLGIDSEEMFAFVNQQLYPYLKENYRLIFYTDEDAFKNMCIYFSRIQDGDEIKVVREKYSEDTKWLHTDDGKMKTSINRYRVFESSPVNISIIKQIVETVFGSGKLFLKFGGMHNQSNEAKKCKTWEQIRDYIEALYHFGYSPENLSFSHLSKYVLSENLDLDFNAFRLAEVLEVIPDGDVIKLSKYFGDIESTIISLRNFGLKQNRDYFVHEGSYLGFGEDTLKILESYKCPEEVLDDICDVKVSMKKDINASYEVVKGIQENALLFLLDENRGLFSTDSYTGICDCIQENRKYWDRDDLGATEVLIRACAGATKVISKKDTRYISITIREALKRKLEGCISKIAVKNKIALLEVQNDGSFTSIPCEEITPLLRLLQPDETKFSMNYYKGQLNEFGGNELYLQDGKGRNVYLQVDENGDYKSSLEAYLDKSFDIESLKYIDEMELQYQDVKENIIVPLFNATGHDLSKTYDEVERRFNPNDKRQIINILSWFRYSGYTNGLGNGNINNEKEIEDDYKNDPWKFVYEFIQNVDDCFFEADKPELCISVKNNNSIVFEYNEVGFSLEDIKALTKFGDSNKAGVLEDLAGVEGLFDREKTGRKGRGFKSVFALPGNGIVVHICSNGFSFKFVKRLGSIIPIWEEIEDAPQNGTRIIVEGFEKNYTEKLENSIRSMFGVEDLSLFYSLCPILYLRKLKKVQVNCGDDSFAIDINSIDLEFSEEIYETKEKLVAGIQHNGQLHSSLWERMKVSVSNHNFETVRFSKMFKVGDSVKVGSVFAPIMDNSTEIEFERGALYRTLPLDEHVISIPLSINAPFDTNSGRSAIDDLSEYNQQIVKFLFNELLVGFYEYLRIVDNIKIEKYIPKSEEILFNEYKNVQPINLQYIVKSIPILRSYSGSEFVACNSAKVLLNECYDWIEPETLSYCFDGDTCQLVGRQYSELCLAKYKVDFRRKDFVNCLNRYLDSIDAADRDLFGLLRDNVYPYIDKYYEDIVRKYRKEGQQGELKKMRIYAFEMSDGSIVREDAEDSIIWVYNEQDEYRSFGKYRCLNSSSLSGLSDKYMWIQEQHEIVNFERAFTFEKLAGSRIKSWSQAAELIETILYYDIKKGVRIPFLSDCVMSEEFDDEENVFRKGYLETYNDEIISHIISRNDLVEIGKAAGTHDENSINELAEIVKGMGLRASDEFFGNSSKGIYELNKSTLALLNSYCRDRETSEVVIKAIEKVFRLMKQEKYAQLHVPYEDIENCHESVFSIIFAYEILSGDMQTNLARKFCLNFNESESIDYVEAYFRALYIIGKAPEEKNISISLSEIIKRGLGECVQNCKINNYSKLKLDIEIDVAVEDYPSKEIDQALRWLSNDNAVSVSYEYYTTDLAKAFGTTNDDIICFLFDDTKVILNTSTAKNSMLKFVQKRYKGKDERFSALVSIISEQNELKENWKKTKKEYIEKLAKFREDTWREQEALFPDYDKHLNDANGNAINYVLPELLQNINDCKRGENQETRTLDVDIDVEKGTMLLRYDEAGFDYQNVYSITAIGQSTKHDESEGEKGLGFKKVFTLFERVDIYSNEFSFFLTSEENTIPKWISDKEKLAENMIPGKTTMLFTVSNVHKNKLQGILLKWKMLMDGEYVGNQISPLFLKNIDYIYLKGYDKHYSRDVMVKEFITMNIKLFSFYKNILLETNVDNVEKVVDELKAELKTRRKCKNMTEDEIKEYIDSLSVDIFIPRKISSKEDKGCFYSTLPTESMLNAAIFINVPLELTTGRDGIVDSSDFNAAIMKMLFVPQKSETAVFYRLLELLANDNRDIVLLDYFITKIKDFINSISNVCAQDVKVIKKALEYAEIFSAYNKDELVSIRDSYSVDRIICVYQNDIQNPVNDVEEWINNHSDKVDDLSLIMPKTMTGCEKLETFAEAINTVEGYFPLIDDNHDYAVEYMMDEYGYVGGNDSDE